jgi:hypothetical protein
MKILRFFDRLEDRIRGRLSRHPLIYGLIAGVFVILFWRGVWEMSDQLSIHPLASLLVGLAGLLLTGVLVSSFIGTRLIISGLKGEKKIEEKTFEEISREEQVLDTINRKLDAIQAEVTDIKKEI